MSGREREPFTFDPSSAAMARAVRRLAVPVDVTCAFCGTRVRRLDGTVVTTRDRAMREGCCHGCAVDNASHATEPLAAMNRWHDSIVACDRSCR